LRSIIERWQYGKPTDSRISRVMRIRAEAAASVFANASDYAFR